MAALLAEFNGYLDVDDTDLAAESRPSWRARPYPILFPMEKPSCAPGAG